MKTKTLCAATLLLSPGALPADELFFKSGRSMQGIVLEENAQTVVFKAGPGKMTLPRMLIDRIERDTADSNRSMESAWQADHYLNPAYVPDGLQPLAEHFTALDHPRRRAQAARSRIRRLGQTLKEAEQQLTDIRMQQQALSRQLNAVDIQSEVQTYNALIKQQNRLNAAYRDRVGTVRKTESARNQALKTVGHYHLQLSDFMKQFNAARATATDGPEPQRFFNRLHQDLQPLLNDFSASEVQTVLQGGSTLVHARINGQAEGLFMLDTGASTVVLSGPFARQIGLDSKQLEQVSATMADGRKVKAGVVMLDSVEAGSTCIRQIRALVMHESIDQEVDGLLGMNFIRNFHLQTDPVSGKLKLDTALPAP